MLTTCAQRAGFGGGVVVDYPNSTKKRKMYLCLMVGHQEVPQGLSEGGEADDPNYIKVKNEKRRKAKALASRKLKGKKAIGAVDKDWILKKKELYRQRKGVEHVPRDSKVRLLHWDMHGSFSLIYSISVYGEETKDEILTGDTFNVLCKL
jgi:18S rRNA (guanine1575-N7)-methyltransferase